MALQKRNTSSTRTIVIAVVILAVAGVGYLLYQQLFVNANDTNSSTFTNGTRPVVNSFGESILNDSRYTTLRSYDVTTNADANVDGGQINPFH